MFLKVLEEPRPCSRLESYSTHTCPVAENMNAIHRTELYSRHEVRLILGWIIDGHDDIQPIWCAGHSYQYSELEKLVGKAASSILEELATEGLLERYPIDRVIVCPRCNSYSYVRDRYLCLFCEGPDLRRGTLVEHYSCGHVDLMERFKLKHVDGLVCPNCSRPLKLIGTDYRRIDNVFRCNDCKRDSSVPKVVHACMRCNLDFNHERARLRAICGYKLRQEYRTEVMLNCTVERPFIEFLKELGYLVEAPKALVGTSGVDHVFDIVCERNNEQVVIALASDPRGVGPEKVVSFFSKLVDVRPTRAVLVAMPALTPHARRIAGVYSIETLEGATLSQIIEQLRKMTGALGRTTEMVLKRVGTEPEVKIDSSAGIYRGVKG